MKLARKAEFFLALLLLAAPLIHGQDLSRYRKFALGTSLAAISKQIGQDWHQTKMINPSPALIEELDYWPAETSYHTVRVDPVSQIVFSFCNGELFKMVVTYDDHATEGLTEEDMVHAISARYGTGIRVYPEINLTANDGYMLRDSLIARWDDPQNSVSLFRSRELYSYSLTVLSKRLNAQAECAISETETLDKENAPQKEIDRKRKEIEDLEVARLANQKTFRP